MFCRLERNGKKIVLQYLMVLQDGNITHPLLNVKNIRQCESKM